MPKRDDAIILYPSGDEITAVLRHAPDRLKRAISISYYTGLRPGEKELYSMRWHHVDFKANTIMVTSAKKGGIKYRDIPLSTKFLALLKQWYEDDGSNPIFEGAPDSNYAKSIPANIIFASAYLGHFFFICHSILTCQQHIWRLPVPRSTPGCRFPVNE